MIRTLVFVVIAKKDIISIIICLILLQAYMIIAFALNVVLLIAKAAHHQLHASNVRKDING